MNINRQNYESCFLLYADNELQDHERSAVEEFLIYNPHLKPEFDLLLQAKLSVPSFLFPAKDSLYRRELDASLQEDLLLFLDGELHSGAEDFQTQMAELPVLAEEWRNLQAVKLNPDDKISFPDKSSLYRKEPSRLIKANFGWRAVAASLFCFLLLSFCFLLYRSSSPEEKPGVIAVTRPPIKVSSSPMVVVDSNNVGSNVVSASSGTANNISVAPDSDQHFRGSADLRTLPAARLSFREGATAASQNISNVSGVSGNNTAKANVERTNPAAEIKILSLPEKTSLAKIEKQDAVLNDEVITLPDNTYSSFTAATESFTENENQIFMIPEEKVSRTKLNGFLKKVRRTITRTANIETGGSVQIGGYAISRK